MSSPKPIGVFDSGFGGISILKALQEILPQESYLYVADSAYCPYGPKSRQEIVDRSIRITKFLLAQECKCIVVACNTATGAAIETLRNQFDVPFIGIEPAVKPAAQSSITKVIGILATEGTFHADHYKETSQQWASDTLIVTKTGHKLVEIVEQNSIFEAASKEVIKNYVQPMIDQNIDRLVLGCTHYPFLIPVLEEIIPSNVQIINPAPAVARQCKKVLHEKNLYSEAEKSDLQFFSSADEQKLETFVNQHIDCSNNPCSFNQINF